MSTEHIASAGSGSGIIVLASARLRSFFCSLHGHDLMLNIQPGRISLQCTWCASETPGWTLKEQPSPSARRRRTQGALVEQSAQ